MSFINYSSREINVKICYFGPPDSGARENVRYLCDKASLGKKGRLLTLALSESFDFQIPRLGSIRGFDLRFHLYSVPHARSLDASRKLIMKGLDGFVFVADSRSSRMDANEDYLELVEGELNLLGVSLELLPFVIQYNRREYEETAGLSSIYASLNRNGAPVIEASVSTGIGVVDTLKTIVKMVLLELRGASPAARSVSIRGLEIVRRSEIALHAEIALRIAAERFRTGSMSIAGAALRDALQAGATSEWVVAEAIGALVPRCLTRHGSYPDELYSLTPSGLLESRFVDIKIMTKLTSFLQDHERVHPGRPSFTWDEVKRATGWNDEEHFAKVVAIVYVLGWHEGGAWVVDPARSFVFQRPDLQPPNSKTVELLMLRAIVEERASWEDGQSSASAEHTWDAFICHASEDKVTFVAALAQRLQAMGYQIWYDDFLLQPGDSLRRSIDLGLGASRYGIVVLSHAFFVKEWPQRELDGLVARESGGTKVVVPVWHGVTRQDVLAHSPSLAERLAIPTDAGVEHVAQKIARTIGPPSSRVT